MITEGKEDVRKVDAARKNTANGSQTIVTTFSIGGAIRPRARGGEAIRTFEGTGSVGLVVPKPEETDDNEEVDDLRRISLHVEDEGIRNRWRGCDEDDYLRIQ